MPPAITHDERIEKLRVHIKSSLNSRDSRTLHRVLSHFEEDCGFDSESLVDEMLESPEDGLIFDVDYLKSEMEKPVTPRHVKLLKRCFEDTCPYLPEIKSYVRELCTHSERLRNVCVELAHVADRLKRAVRTEHVKQSALTGEFHLTKLLEAIEERRPSELLNEEFSEDECHLLSQIHMLRQNSLIIDKYKNHSRGSPNDKLHRRITLGGRMSGHKHFLQETSGETRKLDHPWTVRIGPISVGRPTLFGLRQLRAHDFEERVMLSFDPKCGALPYIRLFGFRVRLEMVKSDNVKKRKQRLYHLVIESADKSCYMLDKVVLCGARVMFANKVEKDFGHEQTEPGKYRALLAVLKKLDFTGATMTFKGEVETGSAIRISAELRENKKIDTEDDSTQSDDDDDDDDDDDETDEEDVQVDESERAYFLGSN
eukprot:784599_1